MSPRLGLAAAVLLVAGCASEGPYWNREDRGAAERIELQEQVVRLEARLAAESARNAALQAKLEALQRETAPSLDGSALPDTPPPEGAATPAPYPVRREAGEIEQSDLEEREIPAAAPSASQGEIADGSGAQELYDRSLAALEQQRLGEAEDGFTRFLAAYPDSDLADNAQFWIAEGVLRRGDVAAALDGFRAVVERFPEGNKVPDALLKVGACLAALGDPESAATVYRELLLRFPETAAGEAARQRLGVP